MTNAGQTCVGIERVYVAAPVYDAFLAKIVEQAARLTVGDDRDADIGPMTMPRQLDVIRRHIDDALARGGRAVLGGPDAVRRAVRPPDRPGRRARGLRGRPRGDVRPDPDRDQGRRLPTRRWSWPTPRATAWAARSSARPARCDLARRLRTGMVVDQLGRSSFAGVPSLPFGGVGDSGFGRIHGDDGLREFTRPKAITRRRMRVVRALDDVRPRAQAHQADRPRSSAPSTAARADHDPPPIMNLSSFSTACRPG